MFLTLYHTLYIEGQGQGHEYRVKSETVNFYGEIVIILGMHTYRDAHIQC